MSNAAAWVTNFRLMEPVKEAHVFIQWRGSPQEGTQSGGWSIDGQDITCSFCEQLFITVPLDEWVEISHGCEKMQPILTRNLRAPCPDWLR
jgi:hypothetical protein